MKPILWLSLVVLVAPSPGPAQAPALEVSAKYLPGDTIVETSWTAVLRDPGKSTLRTAGEDEKTITVPTERLTALREAVVSEHFFDLRKEYGDLPVGGPKRRMEITLGQRTHQVIVFSIKPEMSKQEAEEVDRAMKVWSAVLDCLHLPKK